MLRSIPCATRIELRTCGMPLARKREGSRTVSILSKCLANARLMVAAQSTTSRSSEAR